MPGSRQVLEQVGGSMDSLKSGSKSVGGKNGSRCNSPSVLNRQPSTLVQRIDKETATADKFWTEQALGNSAPSNMQGTVNGPNNWDVGSVAGSRASSVAPSGYTSKTSVGFSCKVLRSYACRSVLQVQRLGGAQCCTGRGSAACQRILRQRNLKSVQHGAVAILALHSSCMLPPVFMLCALPEHLYCKSL